MIVIIGMYVIFEPKYDQSQYKISHNLPNSNGSLVITVRPEVKYILRTVAMLF
jgi:hypothetical protein